MNMKKVFDLKQKFKFPFFGNLKKKNDNNNDKKCEC